MLFCLFIFIPSINLWCNLLLFSWWLLAVIIKGLLGNGILQFENWPYLCYVYDSSLLLSSLEHQEAIKKKKGPRFCARVTFSNLFHQIFNTEAASKQTSGFHYCAQKGLNNLSELKHYLHLWYDSWSHTRFCQIGHHVVCFWFSKPIQ